MTIDGIKYTESPADKYLVCKGCAFLEAGNCIDTVIIHSAKEAFGGTCVANKTIYEVAK